MISVDNLTVKLNCPECRTGYVTDRREITVARPEFDCAACGVRFYIEAPLNSAAEMSSQTFKVPTASPDVNAVLNYQVPHTLTVAWNSIMQDYDNRELHVRFLDQCLKVKKLAFASQLYRARVAANLQDVIAREMGDRAFHLATQHMRSLHPPYAPFTAPGRAAGAGGFWMLLVYLGAIVAIAGLMAPHGKALVACGATMFSLGVGFKWIGRSS